MLFPEAVYRGRISDGQCDELVEAFSSVVLVPGD